MENLPQHPFLPQYSTFRAYDIRGNYEFFTDDFIHALSLSFVKHYKENCQNPQQMNRIVIGYDMRQGSQDIAQQLATTFIHSEFEVVWLGLVTTPILAFWTNQQEKGQQNGIMITASHSEKHITGIKWLVNNQSPTPSEIQALYKDMADIPISVPSIEQIKQSWNNIQNQLDIINNPLEIYQKSIHSVVEQLQSHPKKPITTDTSHPKLINRLVIDCLNGATADFAEILFEPYAHEIIMLNDVADGHFPKGNPDPCEANRLIELQQAVVDSNADLGFAFDGDGDRLMVIDDNGDILDPDNLLFLLAKSALLSSKASTGLSHSEVDVIFDVKCSHHLPNMLRKLGVNPVMSKTGSSHMRHPMQSGESKAIFAGELSGHFIYNDGLFINYDDAMYAAIRLLTWLSMQNTHRKLSQIVASLPTMVSTADTYITVTERSSILTKLIDILHQWLLNLQQGLYTQASKFGLSTSFSGNAYDQSNISNAQLTTIDGIRLDFTNGFGVIRQSNTSQSLTVRFAGNSLADLQKVQQQFVKHCQQLDESLAKAIANIQPIIH